LALLKSISGTRGTIGGKVGENLTAQDIVESTAAYAYRIKKKIENPTIVVGRDARISGELVSQTYCRNCSYARRCCWGNYYYS